MLAKNDVKRANLKELKDKLARYLIYDSQDNAYYFRNTKGKTVFKHKEENHFFKNGRDL